jgi:hypothetical protein
MTLDDDQRMRYYKRIDNPYCVCGCKLDNHGITTRQCYGSTYYITHRDISNRCPKGCKKFEEIDLFTLIVEEARGVYE